MYDPPTSMHVPPLKHGDNAQALIGMISQFIPVKPLGHMHMYDPPTSMHRAPFKHGDNAHALTGAFSQFVPV
jgi:hypothetical protein